MADNTRNIDPLWKLRDVADYCQVSTSTVKRWHREGVLPPPIRLGGSVRWDPADVRAWARERREVEPERARVPA